MGRRGIKSIGFAGTLLIGSALSTDAVALELFGRCIFGTCESAAEKDAAELIDPKTYDVDFQFNGDDGDVEAAVKSASQLWQGRDGAVGGSAGVVARAKGDYRRMLAALYNEGRYGGSISIRVAGDEAANVAVGTEFTDGSSITIIVDPGPAYVFGRADVINQSPPAQTRDDRVPSLDDVGFASGLPARAGNVGKAAKLSRDAWRQQGYAKARIADRRVTANHPSEELNVELEVDPGERAYYGDVDVRGTERMDAAFVARQTGLKPGEEYDPDDLARARKRLDRLGVFSTQKIEEAQELNDDGTLPLSLIVKERKLRRIGVGATVSSVDGVGVETYWLHRNLFGKAERLRVDARVGGLGSTFDYQKFDYFLGAAFTKPGVFTPDTDLNFKLYAKREVNDAFTETSGGGTLSLTHYYSDALTFGGGVFGEYGRFTNTLGTRDFITAGLTANVTYDTRDSKLDPTEGFYFSGDLKPFYEFNFNNFGLRTEAEARAYFSVGEDNRFTLAGRIKAGSIIGPDRSETPDNLLFFAGGGGSVRGYGFNNIGIVEADGTVTGGNSKLEASAELRFKATDTYGAVAFVDAGTVSADPYPSFDQDVRIGAGIGVRYFTGLGPIRLDVALPLNRLDGDPRFGVYAGIGQAF